ncbi:hypothetical protein HF324_16475 [Chitinophaga oryzae]|uniref:Alginate export domain-containing protein n=1 Tax=Chitinophaga oryzae TaxID=2725414 RepID=A0ABX6LKK2_9BACT|nr:hypothetical protein [Chitinophaga oryzae]QJB39368.1 hypothetical protein HF324_16475 [Chitinophaga oryzae]
MKYLFLWCICVVCLLHPAFAQHEHHKGMKMDTARSPEKMGPMQMPMNHAFSLNLPMNRNGSGTSWLPDASPMYGYMFHSRKWMYMVHGNLFLRYTNQDIGRKGVRGGDKFGAPNWFMLMAQRKVGRRGLFHYEVMLSFDRLTEGGAGYPLLFQSGESWKGQPLVDRQHPHDLFSGLSVGYTYALSKNTDIYASFGYPGEPALGSVAFMHRPSAMNNPDAPISHHWNDGTHITFGVATLGVRLHDFKLEGSIFTGREPDENRYDFDRMRFDSWSGRLSYNPSRNWALQVSHGHIKSPELLHPGEDVNRTTASAVFSQPLQHNNHLNITGLWGLNKSKDHTGENALLLEGALNVKRVAVYTRYEWVQKSTEELDLPGTDNLFGVHAVTGGISYDLLRAMHTRLAIGVQGSVFFNEKALYSLYGKNPLAGEVYLRLYPDLMKP